MITKLILKNYTPLFKKNVTFVELNTKDMFNIILGRNGFGKTSLMRELTPFPPDNADYEQGGYKEVHIVVGKNTYILKSSTGKSSEHHFIHNGKNLNEGNTLLAQRDLVKIHFGITQNIKNFVTGLDVRDLFTTLSSARRKELLMAINPNDTSYALKMFDKLKSNHNAIKGGLKTQRQRLVVEESRLAQLAAMNSEKLQDEIKGLDGQIKNALIIHGELQHIKHESISPLKDEIGNITSFLIGRNTQVTQPMSVLLQQKENLMGTLDYHKAREIRFSTMLTEFASQLAGLGDAGANLDSYKLRLSNILMQREEAQNKFDYLTKRFENHPEFVPQPTEERDFVYFVNRASNFIYQIQSINRAIDPDITSAKFKDIQQKLVQATHESDNLKRKANEITHTLEHYSRADSVDCPKCQHQFKPGFTEIDPGKLREQVNGMNQRRDALKDTITEYTRYIEDNQGWYDSMMDMLRFSQASDIPQIYSTLIRNYGIGKRDTNVLISLVEDTVEYVSVKESMSILDEEKVSVEKQIVFLESSDVETLCKRAEWVERELAATQRSVRRILNKLDNIRTQIDLINEDEQRRDRLAILMDELSTRLHRNGQFKIKLRVEEIINDLTPRKEQLISNLIRAESLHSVIQSIKDNLADLERREKHTQLLLDGLSPVKGLIGYLMNDFLKSVVANVNAIIQPIWTNRLSVLNCSTSKSEEDVELSYNFPLISGPENKASKDVGEGSGGEREIINFAFRLVLRRYLGERCPLPLMMDEVGVAFDELHRGRFFAYIAEQTRLDKLPQTFMISHNYKEYAGNFAANIIALNIEGIRVGFAVNENSVIR
jgi:DNA repair exonuclease SbcCD ATPase subunit